MGLSLFKAKFITFFVYNFFWYYMKFFCQIKILNLKSLPEPPYILVANHCSYLDWGVLYAFFKKFLKYDIVFIGKKKLFSHGLFKYCMQASNTICIEQDKLEKSFFKNTKDVFSSKNVLGIFPEGQRSLTGEINKGFPGAVTIAMLNNVPIVPVGLIGFHDVLPPGKFFLKPHKCKIIFGEALYFKGYNARLRKDHTKVDEITNTIMGNIAELIGQKVKKETN